MRRLGVMAISGVALMVLAGGRLLLGGIHIYGYGPGQDDNLVHSYTVGRAMETGDRDPVTVPSFLRLFKAKKSYLSFPNLRETEIPDILIRCMK